MLKGLIKSGLIASLICFATVGNAQGENTIEINGGNMSSEYVWLLLVLMEWLMIKL